jgi:hypothetical protein
MRRFKTKIAGVYGAFSLRAAVGAAAFAEWEGGSPIAACTGKKRDLRGAIAYGGDTKRQFRILLVTLKTYWTKKHGFLVFCGL